MIHSRRIAVFALTALCVLQMYWHGWIGLRQGGSWLRVLIAVLPLLLPLLGALKGWPNALFWGAFISLLFFCHGIVEAWMAPQWRLLGMIEASLSSILVLATARFGLQRRVASRRRAENQASL